MRRLANRPGISRSPALILRNDVSKTRAVEYACVLPLEPVIEPSECLDVKALPRPGEAMLSHHGDLHMLAVGQPLVSGESVREMERHVLPVASQIDWHLDAIEQRKEIAVLPPSVAERMFRSDSAPDIVPRMRIV